MDTWHIHFNNYELKSTIPRCLEYFLPLIFKWRWRYRLATTVSFLLPLCFHLLNFLSLGFEVLFLSSFCWVVFLNICHMYLTDTFVECTRGAFMQSLLNLKGLFLSSEKLSQINNGPSRSRKLLGLDKLAGRLRQCLPAAWRPGRFDWAVLTKLKGLLLNGSLPP